MSLASDVSDSPGISVDFSSFRNAFSEKIHQVFNVRGDIDEISLERGLPPFALREIQSQSPLSVFIPDEYGGRGGHPKECQSILATASYESLALSLMIGINGALFLQPLAKYGNESVKRSIFERFIEEKHMGGLMITEPDYGTDALHMQTSYTQQEDGSYHIEGLKHWAGLTGWADFWLVTARRKNEKGQLSRDLDFFIADMNQPGQEIEVEEFYENLGLYMIPYGRNRIDITVPEEQRLEPESTGIKMMLDTLHRSRIEFPGMGMGFLQRMLDEALDHCRERFVGGKSLMEYDQVKKRIARMQAWYTACSAMCTFASEKADLDNNLASCTVEANSVKSVVTDLMQDSAQSLLQLTGAKGYRLDHIAGRSVVDSRPFQIFEGSNDVLYQQISESVLKKMRRFKEKNLYHYLKDYELTERAADYFKDTLNFKVDLDMPQRKLVEMGRMIGRIVSMEMTIEMGDRGFRSDLVSNCLNVFRQDVKSILSRYKDNKMSSVIEDYVDGSGWLNFVRTESA
jgi:alkylation response protein AidB-like acyl-CoA dehydrogenase